MAGGVPPATRQRPPTARVAHLRAPPDRGPGLRPRLGRRIPPRRVAAAFPGHQRRPGRHPEVRPHHPAMAQGPGQALDPRASGRRDQLLTRLQRHRRGHPLRGVPVHPRGRDHPPRHRPRARGTLPGLPAHGRARCPGPHHAHRSAEHLPADDPPQRLGRRSAVAHRDGVQRRLPQATRAGAPVTARERHGASRRPRQPGPLQRPELAADHRHPHPLRAAHHLRHDPRLRLPGHRRRRGTLPALPQPEDETGSARPHRRRAPADDQPSPAADRGALARGPRAVPTHESQHRGHPPGRSPRLPRRPGSLAARLRRP